MFSTKNHSEPQDEDITKYNYVQTYMELFFQLKPSKKSQRN